jgi:N utilization substance protein B
MRRRSRECALQILYQLDLAGQLDAADALDRGINAFWLSFDDAQQVDRAFAERLVRGVCSDRAAIDASIEGAAEHWRIERMNAVDRNVMRVAAYEIERCPDIPVGVSINEALEIARRFSGSDAVAFINGVLDQIARRSAAAGSEG